MAAPDPFIDLATVDLTRVLADRDAIYAVLPHRGAMELLTAIVHVDSPAQIMVGYKDLGMAEFWCAGHFPGLAIMPGVLMCEAAAQLCAYFALTQGGVSGKLMGLGGIENTRFRRTVKPGERLVLVGKGVRVRPRLTQIAVQGFVGDELAFHTEVIGMPIAALGEASASA
ncbi:MAG: 3-hydroxyacyl-ACP dehydratase FabZ family protein [Fimbriiglobus sp.]